MILCVTREKKDPVHGSRFFFLLLKQCVSLCVSTPVFRLLEVDGSAT